MAELADAPDLGSGVPDVKVQVLLPAPIQKGNLVFPFCIGLSEIHGSSRAVCFANCHNAARKIIEQNG